MFCFGTASVLDLRSSFFISCELPKDEDLDMQDAILESMFSLLNDDFSPHTERKSGLDFPSPSDFTNSNGKKMFEDTKSSDGLYIDSDGYLTQKLSTSPKCHLRGRSSSGTEVLHVEIYAWYY